ncbi:MAG: flippase-like domain-containing protein [Anaerolineales bacterium]|nr:flippase-like domain-containing protein [Anaerolineales bacterium]
MRRNLQWIVSLLISAAALAWAVRDVRLADLGAALSAARYGYLAPALAFILVGQLARARSWQTLLGREVPFARAFGALNAGYLLNNVLPFRLGEVGRAYLVSRSGRLTTAQALSSVLLERVIDLSAIVGMLTAFVPLVSGLVGGPAALALIFLLPAVALAGLFVVARKPAWLLGLVRWGVGVLGRLWGGAARLEELFAAFLDGLGALQDPRRLANAAVFSALAWGCAGLSAWMVLLAFDAAAGPELAFFMLVVTGLSIAVPSAPGSLGVWQAAGVAALGVFGRTGALALSMTLTHHLVNYLSTSLMGAVALAQAGESLDHLARSARALLTNDERRTTGAPR